MGTSTRYAELGSEVQGMCGRKAPIVRRARDVVEPHKWERKASKCTSQLDHSLFMLPALLGMFASGDWWVGSSHIEAKTLCMCLN